MTFTFSGNKDWGTWQSARAARWSCSPVWGHSRPARFPPYQADQSRSPHHCLRPASGTGGASGHEHTFLGTINGVKTCWENHRQIQLRANGYKTQSPRVTFEAAVFADEEQADFVLVSIARGFRSAGGFRFDAKRPRSGASQCLRHCRRQESTRELRGSPLPLPFDDEFISVYLKEVFNVLATEALEKFLVDVKMMGPLAGGSKRTVPLEKMLADVKLRAEGAEFAGAVQPVTLVVMGANLRGDTTASHSNHDPLGSLQGLSPREAGEDRSAATAGTAVSLSNPEDPDSSKSLGFFQNSDCGSFYTSF